MSKVSLCLMQILMSVLMPMAAAIRCVSTNKLATPVNVSLASSWMVMDGPANVSHIIIVVSHLCCTTLWKSMPKCLYIRQYASFKCHGL